jgi:hypothetical protein
MADLLDLIATSPVGKETKNHCPNCKGGFLDFLGSSTTMLSWTGGKNPNHQKKQFRCKGCKYEFTIEEKLGNKWWTESKSNVVLIGVPNCYESYVLKCKCNGLIFRTFTQEDGDTPIHILRREAQGRKYYRTFWTCRKCKQRLETEEDHL